MSTPNAFSIITLHCLECSSIVKINDCKPITNNVQYKYCPKCGTDNTVPIRDDRQSYWDLLATEYKMSSVAIRQIYEIWRKDDTHPGFRRFVEEFRALVKASAKEDGRQHSETSK